MRLHCIISGNIFRPRKECHNYNSECYHEPSKTYWAWFLRIPNCDVHTIVKRVHTRMYSARILYHMWNHRRIYPYRCNLCVTLSLMLRPHNVTDQYFVMHRPTSEVYLTRPLVSRYGYVCIRTSCKTKCLRCSHIWRNTHNVTMALSHAMKTVRCIVKLR
jgi:hypothetical protein